MKVGSLVKHSGTQGRGMGTIMPGLWLVAWKQDRWIRLLGWPISQMARERSDKPFLDVECMHDFEVISESR